MIKKAFIVIFACFISTSLFADFKEGKKLFEQKCAQCHKGYISFKKLKENFYERNNQLLNLEIPTENMLAWAIIDSSRKIGDPNDEEMRLIEIEEYLKNYLANPDTNNSICDQAALKYYKKKEPLKITEEEAELLAEYFMGYKEDRLKNMPEANKVLSSNYDEKEILKEAQNKGKHIIVYATSKTCYFCKKMEKDVLSKQDVKDIMAEDYIFLKVDVDYVKLPFGLKKHFKGMTPTFFVLTSGGELLNTYPGAWVKNDYLQILKENL
ncbi:thioredoxin family protein [Arcobacter sp. CECT 8983]|uniref:thioredoxin family protein n=1 Tax=Arcobacter sp. CECT 8983 TaxID=2044508 RepID=UPI00100AE35E|nr:thioredoxin family protein [Arcobacter sp. CECT 8983]RXJ89208.1 thioredoxin family protein [Arcobacter sp. CECT 8983]